MPRIARNALCGNFFHIIVQGINKEFIFKEDKFKDMYINLLMKETKENNIQTLAYCIMNNHVHFLAYVENVENMSKCMQKVNTSYGRFYNKINQRVGFVFRDRYYTQTIKNEKHLISCIAYIHKNPVKAKIVANEEEYKYSSYNEYSQELKRKLITDDSVAIVFGDKYFENIKETFYEIHKMNNEEEQFEIKDNIDYNEMVEEYKNQNLQTESIVDKLYNVNKVSTREISEILGISRYFIRKVLKQEKCKKSNSPN